MRIATALLLLASPAALAAQTAAPAEGPAPSPPIVPAQAGEPAAVAEAETPLDEEEDFLDQDPIVVTGQKLPGSVVGDIQPEQQLGPREIRAHGASTVGELLESLAPQTRSLRGRGEGGPVVLLNGRRISSFAEIRDLPPEAILRVDILPEEAALQYGYRADQRVVNFVLRPRFRAITTEAAYGMPTAGGRASYEAEANVLRLTTNGRWNLGAEYERDTALFEDERDIVGADPFRTLLPERDQLTLNGTGSRLLGEVTATVNARTEFSGSTTGLGLGPAGQRLRRDGEATNAHAGFSLGGDLSRWRWSLTGNFDRNISESRTDIAGQGTRDFSRTENEVMSAEAIAGGPIFTLPAGPARASFRAGADRRGLDGRSVRGGVEASRALRRGRVAALGNLDLPVASRRRGVLQPLGDLSVNVNYELEQLSDFGTLRTLGYGLVWSPLRRLTFIASMIDEDGAPAMAQLGDPPVVTPNVRTFDFVRGESVDISRIDGGNALLVADRRRSLRLGANFEPQGLLPNPWTMSLNASFTRTRIDDPIAAFPIATAEIEAAFPDRFTRDATGRLLRIDARPVNFARSEREEMRWGINLTRPLGPQRGQGFPFRGRGPDGAPGRPEGGGGSPSGGSGDRTFGQGPGGGRGGFGGRGFGRGGGFGGFGGGGALQAALYHIWRFEDSVLIRPGVPELDFLDGSAASRLGGSSEHEIELQAGWFERGLGARLNATWRSGTFVRGAAGTGDLEFSDTLGVGLRLFADLGQQRWLMRGASPGLRDALRGLRLSVSIDNLFDSAPRVTDAFGVTPSSYQPDLLNPLGRTVRLTIRKQFFPGLRRIMRERAARRGGGDF